MFTYSATISKNMVPAGLIPSWLTSKLGWNFTYNEVSDQATNKLKVSQLTSCEFVLFDLHICTVNSNIICEYAHLRISAFVKLPSYNNFFLNINRKSTYFSWVRLKKVKKQN